MSQAQDASFSDKLIAYAQDRLDRLHEQCESALASGDVDAVHATRVASRRLNEALVVMRPWLDRGDVKIARRGLRALRNCFREVRDLDVLQMSLAQSTPGLDPGSLAQLEGVLTRKRERVLAASTRDAGRVNPSRLVRQVGRLCERFERRFDDAQDRLSARLAAQFQKLATVVLAHDPRGADSGDLHFIRIRVKRARYCAELANRVGALSDDSLVQALTEMQEHTGRWNDHLNAARWISRIARGRDTLARQTVWSLRLLEYAVQRLQAADAERRLVHERWPAFDAAIRASSWFRGAESSSETPQPATTT